MDKVPCVYIITNHTNTVLYVGVTSDLVKRIYEHKNKLIDGFSCRYNLNKLVYYEVIGDMYEAIAREKYLKGKSRSYKNNIINSFNPDWGDLYETII